ncbi:L-tyrosine/L-tryptophan isonitrile synthase family protein [Peredibacter starrii]|uniref:L-tyrosine/L-tryptophan isonitrile synthase family protein n=1 Tax=Peredibacter starrii TaxID=28202 RepID=A0AAX4HVA9_9BACT|nr:L-tyrosine/L-tryptophan isonitrile synthase family protein [Peredibacter starrii]WPU67023.1 L-tyrosine/L-tryptophan isonitrile synthase family protein [Peredibacter starrii]
MIAQEIKNTNLTQSIVEAMEAVSKLSSNELTFDQFLEVPLMQNMASQMATGRSLKFLLPAFPAKSPSPVKTSGALPDFGEVIALQALNEMCAKITANYKPGAQVVICSDGRVFSDVVNVSDKTIDAYSEGIQSIINEFNLTHLSTFSLEDLYPNLSGPELRNRLLWQFAKSIEEVRHQVIEDRHYQGLFNGMHKFMVEDRMGIPTVKSKNQINKETKSATYELMRRSDAWSALLNHYFKGALRLSIHPYPHTHEKFGVKLVSSSSKWATPWHNVTVKVKDKYELMHLAEAERLGAEKKVFGGKYVFFEA